MLTSSGRASLNLSRPRPSELLREIDDPNLGRRWLLYRDSGHPGGPGRLVLAGSMAPDRSHISASGSEGIASTSRPVIRGGDPVVLEESTPIVDARLQAIALGPALEGSRLKVRLAIGGKVVAAIAIAPGRVELAPQLEGQP